MLEHSDENRNGIRIFLYPMSKMQNSPLNTIGIPCCCYFLSVNNRLCLPPFALCSLYNEMNGVVYCNGNVMYFVSNYVNYICFVISPQWRAKCCWGAEGELQWNGKSAAYDKHRMEWTCPLLSLKANRCTHPFSFLLRTQLGLVTSPHGEGHMQI